MKGGGGRGEDKSEATSRAKTEVIEDKEKLGNGKTEDRSGLDQTTQEQKSQGQGQAQAISRGASTSRQKKQPSQRRHGLGAKIGLGPREEPAIWTGRMLSGLCLYGCKQEE